MYKAVEDDPATQMELTPRVYRAVGGAYRSHSQTVDVKVLNAIDELPDELLVNARWLRRRRVSLEENSELERLRKELREGRPLSTGSRSDLYQRIASSYKTLYDRGISSSSTSIDLIGGAATAGYWKSLVQTERTGRWAWVDDGFVPLVRWTVARALSHEIGHGIVREEITEDEISATDALENLRAGRDFKNVSTVDVSRWMLACVDAREQDTPTLVDMSYLLEHQRTTRFAVSYAGTDPEELRGRGDAWLAKTREVLRAHGMAVLIEGIKEIDAPTNREVWRLARPGGIVPPYDVFGPGLMFQAVHSFVQGDLDGALELFELLLQDRDDPQIRNNLAYCFMAMGRAKEALPHIRKGAEVENALREHNLAIAETLNGDLDSARTALRHAWKMQEEDPVKDDVVCMLVLSRDHSSADSIKGIPLPARVPQA